MKTSLVTSNLPSTKNNLAAMDVGRVLRMKEGLGETSYAQNSSLQNKSMESLKHLILASAVDFYSSTETPKTLNIAELGCSSGPNAFSMAEGIIKAIDSRCREASQPPPEFMVFLNDLPTSDFNSVFLRVPEFVSKMKNIGGGGPLVIMAGVPGTFYGRLFPTSSLHFISSAHSLHWLSQLPPGLFDEEGRSLNKGKMCISPSSPPSVVEAYVTQFQKDFALFLKSRSEELKHGGRMVLILLGRKSDDHYDKDTIFLWEVLAQSFALMVSQGLIEEEKLDSYDVPFYAPSPKDIEDEVHKEGSFAIDHLQADELLTSTGSPEKDGKIAAMAVRAIQESMICHHFGGEIVEALFENYSRLLTDAMRKEEMKAVRVIAVLRKEH